MLLVLGLDGADWRLLAPWLADGTMPRLAALRARAACGDLRSTIRPESSIAWTTFATGVNAGRHGVFGFSAQRPASYETTLNTAANIHAPTFWQRAAAAGKRVAVCNVPMTYPPQPFAHGALISDMLTPHLRSRFTHPPELREALLAAVPDYVLEVDRAGLSLRDFLRANTQALAARGRALLWLLNSAPWDAFVGVFTDTDRLQHFTLHLLDPQHPHHQPAEAARLLPELRAAYQTLDASIGNLLDAVGPDATVILLSDHGFAPCARTFYPNAWLAQQGWLRRKPAAAPAPSLWQRLRGHARLRQLKRLLPMLRDWQRPPAPGAALAGVDWPQTAAVFSPAGGIRFNVRGREPQGILSAADLPHLGAELTAALLTLVDPVTARTPLLAVHARQELYKGPYLDRAPDLILEPRRSDPDSAANTTLAYDLGLDAFGSSRDLTGNHTLAGILLAAGPDISAKVIDNARLLDLAPTLLHALALPVPAELEGVILPLWTTPRQPPTETGTAAVLTPPPEYTFSAAEEAEIANRLRALGYL